MFSNRLWKKPIVVVAAAVSLVGAGVAVGAVAATSTPTAKACISSKGYLGVANSKGKCAKGYKGVTINQQGPRGAAGQPGKPGKPGAAGPGARTAVLDITAGTTTSKVFKLGTDTVFAQCSIDGPLSSAEVLLDGDATGNGMYVHGTLYALTANDVLFEGQGGSAPIITFGQGINLVAAQASSAKRVTIGAFENKSTTGSAYGTTHVLVNDGTTVYTVDASIYSSLSRCQVVLSATPGS